MSEPVTDVEDVDTLENVDVNQYTTTITYGIFNDPQVWESRFGDPKQGLIPISLREQLLETPLYEDDSVSRTLRHARLTNEDRARRGTLDRDGMVIIKRQVTLRSPWLLDVDDPEVLTQRILDAPPVPLNDIEELADTLARSRTQSEHRQLKPSRRPGGAL